MSIDRRQALSGLGIGAVALAFGGIAASTGASAQTRDLTVEAPAPTGAKPRPSRQPVLPVNVSLMPVGPSVVPVGSRIRLRIQSNNNGFGHLYVANASGKVVLLAENLPLRANRALDLPRGGMILRASPPTGDNVVHFLATRTRFPGFAGGTTTTTPLDIQVSSAALEPQLATRLSEAPRNQWGMTKVTIRVVD